MAKRIIYLPLVPCLAAADGAENIVDISIVELVTQLQKQLTQISEEHRATAMLNIRASSGDEQVDLYFTTEYRR